MIGRKIEQELLQEAVEKDRAQFIAVYGQATDAIGNWVVKKVFIP